MSLKEVIDKIKEFFTKGHERSLKAKRNIILSFILRGVSVVVSFVMVPITLHYLNRTKYGIWLTLSSIISWFYILDIGLGSGLRNKFAEALAKGDKGLAKTYVSTTYAMLGIIIVIFYTLFLAINPYINWIKILNTTADLSLELNQLILIVVTLFSMQFILKLIGTILMADQNTALNDLLGVVSSVSSLLVIYILSKTTNGSLLYLGTAFVLLPVIVYLVMSSLLYKGKYKEFRPSIKYIDFKHGKDLSSLGVKFFIIQISGIMIYSMSNIIITQILGPAEVVPYNISYKYFNTAIMFFIIIMTPFWSGFTDAYSKEDFEWIKNTMRKLNYISVGFMVIIFLMIIFANIIFKLWIGNLVKIPFLLTLFMGMYVMVLSWGTPFVFFINGVGKIKLQLYTSLIAGVINIPLAIYFVKYIKLGAMGVIISILVLNIIAAIIYPIQYKKIINKKAQGIWNE